MAAAGTTAPARRSALRDWLHDRVAAWSRRRHGEDRGSVTIGRRRVYILPTRLGFTYGAMLFAMLLGGLNYGSNLALALTFLLAAGAWVTMHECHRNLVGLELAPAGTRAPFAGDPAEFAFALTTARARHDLELRVPDCRSPATSLAAGSTAVVAVSLPTTRRGRVRLERLRVESKFPLGLYTAWTWLHPALECVVYPRPAPRGRDAPPPDATAGSAQDGRATGEEDFAGLRAFRAGDPPRRIAWKAYARGAGLVVKEYVGSARAPVTFDWASVPGRDVESRLARLARWIVDAEERGDRYGLRLPGRAAAASATVAPGSGLPHRNRCLARLATFGLEEPSR